MIDKSILSIMPEYIAREDIPKFFGSAINLKYLSNLDSKGMGCQSRMKLGRKNIYKSTDFLNWIETRLTAIPKRKAEASAS